MQNQTENNPQPNDFKERSKGFFDKYAALVKEFEVDFGAYPMFIPDGQKKGGFRIIVQMTPVDLKGRPIPSPFVK